VFNRISPKKIGCKKLINLVHWNEPFNCIVKASVRLWYLFSSLLSKQSVLCFYLIQSSADDGISVLYNDSTALVLKKKNNDHAALTVLILTEVNPHIT
jgi:hypothetical protein